MRIGTKSILLGAHCFFLHPWFVAWAWWKLFGFPWDPRLWVAFFVHDLGYWGKPNMDGDEGEQHVQWGAHLMGTLFGHGWYEFCVLHSRFWAKKLGQKRSCLCIADKGATVLTPWWLYVPMVRLTGEIREYKGIQKHVDDLGERHEGSSFLDDATWFIHLQQHLDEWISNEVFPYSRARWRSGYGVVTRL